MRVCVNLVRDWVGFEVCCCYGYLRSSGGDVSRLWCGITFRGTLLHPPCPLPLVSEAPAGRRVFVVRGDASRAAPTLRPSVVLARGSWAGGGSGGSGVPCALTEPPLRPARRPRVSGRLPRALYTPRWPGV